MGIHASLRNVILVLYHFLGDKTFAAVYNTSYVMLNNLIGDDSVLQAFEGLEEEGMIQGAFENKSNLLIVIGYFKSYLWRAAAGKKIENSPLQ